MCAVLASPSSLRVLRPCESFVLASLPLRRPQTLMEGGTLGGGFKVNMLLKITASEIMAEFGCLSTILLATFFNRLYMVRFG